MAEIKLEELATLEFTPWARDSEEAEIISDKLCGEVVDQRAVYARLALALMFQTKDEIISFLARLDEGHAEEVAFRLFEAEQYYKAVHALLLSATARLSAAVGTDFVRKTGGANG